MSGPEEKDTATSIAREAGCSRQLVTRLLNRGMTRSEIVERMRLRRETEAAKAEGRPTNGHAAALDGIPPFFVSQARREYHQAELKSLEVAERRHMLMKLEPVQAVASAALFTLHNLFAALPEEVSGEFGHAHAQTLRRRIAHIFSEAQRTAEWVCARYGVPPPSKEPPPPPPELLADYRRYVRGSMTGETECVGALERLGSFEWRQAHPSVADRWFDILQLKREWDADMARLLARRAEWDLPPEPAVSAEGPLPLPDD